MSKKHGFERLIEQCADAVHAQISLDCVGWQHQAQRFPNSAGSTPIESLFLFALMSHVQYLYGEWTWKIVRASPSDDLKKFKEAEGYTENLIIQSQVQLDGWRVDFLINAYADWAREPSGGPAGWRRLIVECDGHDFHERTKEQAAKDRGRDRWAQSQGYEVYRFTGSELWRDPLGCADQVVQWANRGV